MNCQRFRNQLFEYVEGSLPADERDAAVMHLTQCAACRQMASAERQRSEFLASGLRRGTETISLRPEVRRHVLRSVFQNPARESAGFWRRFSWQIGLGTCVLAVAAVLQISHYRRAQTDKAGADFSITIEDSCTIPKFTFKTDGHSVIDSISYETVVIHETLAAERKVPVPPKTTL